MLKETFAESIAASRERAKRKYTDKFLQEIAAAKGFSSEFKSRLREKLLSKIGSLFKLGG